MGNADARLRADCGAPQKPYLTEAPAVVAMFKQAHSIVEGKRVDNYYVNESCGIAAGFLIAALHNVGLATLTSTPMGAEQGLRQLLGRPDNEKLFLLMRACCFCTNCPMLCAGFHRHVCVCFICFT